MAAGLPSEPLAKFSLENTSLLIDIIQSHEAVWDVRHAYYRNITTKPVKCVNKAHEIGLTALTGYNFF